MTSIVFSQSKICRTCNQEKPVSEFSKRKVSNDGFQPSCKICKAAIKREWYKEHKEHCAKTRKDWYETNKESIVEYNKQYYEENRGSINSWQANRRATKLQATPSWCEYDAIERLYAECKQITETSGVSHEVDHIVPLQSELVCGLHCLANLQIIPALENASKKNFYWPDMP